MKPFYVTRINISDVPVLSDSYDLPYPHNKKPFQTRPDQSGVNLGIKHKFNYHNCHKTPDWKIICERVRVSLAPFYGELLIENSWLNCYKEGNAVQWHNHLLQKTYITSLLFLNTHPTPLMLSTSTTLDDWDEIKRGNKTEICITDKIDTLAGKLIAFETGIAHMVPECEKPDRWTLTTNFRKIT
jgi:hypothetical protein